MPSPSRALPLRAALGLALALLLAATGTAAATGGGDDAAAEDGRVRIQADSEAVVFGLLTESLVSGGVASAPRSLAASAAPVLDRAQSHVVAAVPEPAPAPPAAPPVPAPAAPGSVEAVIDAAFGPHAGAARAIARCESRMDPNAVSPTNDHGLFQINIVHRGQFEAVTGAPWSAVYDPALNTRYARWLFDQQGWSPWVCARKVL